MFMKKMCHFRESLICYLWVVWRNSRQIGAAWEIRKDKRLVVSIKYNPGGNYVGYFTKNVFPPTGSTLGPNWPYSPPKFTRCPSPRSAAARKRVCGLYMVVGTLVFFSWFDLRSGLWAWGPLKDHESCRNGRRVCQATVFANSLCYIQSAKSEG